MFRSKNSVLLRMMIETREQKRILKNKKNQNHFVHKTSHDINTNCCLGIELTKNTNYYDRHGN